MEISDTASDTCIKYERLIADFDGVVREVLEFLEVDWHDDVTRFYDTKRVVDNSNAWTVRRPVYDTSIGKWTKYREYIKGFDMIRVK